jgi:hypothetical protein
MSGSTEYWRASMASAVSADDPTDLATRFTGAKKRRRPTHSDVMRRAIGHASTVYISDHFQPARSFIKEPQRPMKNPKKVPFLVDTLSVRFPHEVFLRLVAASKRDRRTLSDYVRLLVERAEQHPGA